MPSATHQLIEHALLLTLGSSIALDRYSPQDLGLEPYQYDIHWFGAFALLGALLFFHHWRKELLPLYVSAGLRVASLFSIFLVEAPEQLPLPLFRERHPWVERLSITGVMLATLLALVLPLPDLSALYGKYQTIGCRTVRLGGVECRVFYPSSLGAASVSTTKRVPYLHHGKHLARGIQHFSRVPHWFFTNLENAFLAALPDAPVAARPVPTNSAPGESSGGRWPLVVFSHGLGGSLELYSFFNQQLASAGNVVVVLSHGDGSASVTRPADDRVEYYQQISDEVRDDVDGAGFRFRNAQLRTRVQEMRRVVDAVAALAADSEDALWRSVDLTRVHAAGHSFGAATALTTTHEDARFGAAVLLDAWMEPVDEHVLQGLGDRAPMLHLGSDPFCRWKVNADRVKQHASGCSHADTRAKRVAGSRHNNFSDLPLFSPLINRIVKTAGSIDPTHALKMVAQLSAAFLVSQYDAAVRTFPDIIDMDDEPDATEKKSN